SRRPPRVTKDSGSHGLVLGRPSTRRAWTYLASAEAAGASMTIRCPEPRVMTTCGNRGLARTSSARPGICGYMPRAAHTYHAEVAPRSSLPGRPSGVGWNSSSAERRTTSWVLYGAPAHAYSHGTSKDGSLAMNAYG